MYSTGAKTAYAKLLKVAMQKLASTYGVVLQSDTGKMPRQGAKNASSPKR